MAVAAVRQVDSIIMKSGLQDKRQPAAFNPDRFGRFGRLVQERTSRNLFTADGYERLWVQYLRL